MINPHVLRHMPPIAGKLAVAFEMDLKPRGWELGNIKGGYNSYYLHKPGDRRQFHIRWIKSDKNALTLYPMFFHGNKNGIRIETDDDLMRLVLKMTKPVRMKKAA